ncbi:hypothetical protein CW304_12120 [Bacillus sp. UFRGS-B20]|nr:hypothetical protein CW304_12120 [Bacillus sp. UFRGS-B20]
MLIEFLEMEADTLQEHASFHCAWGGMMVLVCYTMAIYQWDLSPVFPNAGGVFLTLLQKQFGRNMGRTCCWYFFFMSVQVGRPVVAFTGWLISPALGWRTLYKK